MPAHRSHGRPYVEAPRHNELPPGIPAPAQGDASGDPRQNGKLATGASKVPALGGKATKGHTSLSHRIPEAAFEIVSDAPEAPADLEAGKREAAAARKRVRALRKALSREYRQTVGGGYAGVGTNLLLKLVAVAAEMHEQALRRGDEEATRKHADTVKTTLAYAREECARVAAARPRQRPDLASVFAAGPDDEEPQEPPVPEGSP